MLNHSPDSIDLTHLAVDAVQDVLPQAVAGAVVVAAHMVGPGPFVVGEASALSLAVAAVLDNAVNETPPAGVVEVLVREEGDQGQFVVRFDGAGHQPPAGRLGDARRLVMAQGGALDVSVGAGPSTTVTLTWPVAGLATPHQRPALTPATSL